MPPASTSPFALRYPKVNLVGLGSAVSATTKIGTGQTIIDRDLGIPVAPARYTAMRKVTFFCHVRYNSAATTRSYQPFIGFSAVSGVDNTPRTYSVPLNSVQNAAVDTPLWAFSVGVGDRLFDARGPAVSIAFNGTIASPNNRTYLLGLTFDVSNNDHADFWALWNTLAAAGDKDAYMMFYIGLESLLASDADLAALVIFSHGMTIVQAPTAGNETCTTMLCQGGYGETTGYSQVSTQTTGTANAMPWTWQYNAAEWDGVVSINAMTLGRNTVSDNTQTVQFRLGRIEPTFSNYLAENHNPGNGSLVGRGFMARSSDFKALLVDGETYLLEWVRGTGKSINVLTCWLEIIQENFSVTTTYHDASAQGSSYSLWWAGTTFTSYQLTNYGEHTSSYFDPTWYQNMIPRLLKSRFYGALLHISAGNNPDQVIVLDPTLQGDNNLLASTTDLQISPDITATPTASTGIKIRRADITANSPITLSGAMRFMWGKTENRVWDAGGNDNAGQLGIYYTYTVPETEVPDLGPLFEVDAFAPEGCAATAAGGGEPGILAITNGSTIPSKFDPAAQTIDDLGVPTPFEGETPSSTQEPVAMSPAGLGLSNGTYVYRYTFESCCTGKESDPNPDDIEVVVTAGGGGLAAAVTLSFANVVIPGDDQICRICVYRSVNGGAFPIMAKVGCFDPDVTTLFTDVLSDDQLDFTNDGLSILNAPPPCAPIVVDYKNRLFMMGDIPQRSPAGTVSTVNGSQYVVGSFDVEWDRCLEGKLLQVTGDCLTYEIERVLPPEEGTSPPIQRLKLVEEYQGDTTTGALYTICGHANRLWYSEPFEPECWPLVNFIDIEPGDGDRLMGGCSNFDRLVICKRNKTYVLAFQETPAEVNCPTRVSSDIGCVGPRTFAQIESGTAWLAERGVAMYDGRGVQHVEASMLINEIFTDPDNPRYVRKDVNGRVIDAVGVFYPKREQYLLLLPTVQTVRGCNLLLVWDIKANAITLHEFCQEFQSMVVAKDSDGDQRVYVGDTNGFVWLLDIGATDGAGTPGQTGTVMGTASDGGFDEIGVAFLEDDSATFLEGGLPALAGLSGVVGFSGSLDGGNLGLAGVCLYVRRDADSEWIQRTIFAATQTTLFVTPAWSSADTPESGWEYMIGPIDMLALFKPTDFGTGEDLRNWRIMVQHVPEDHDSQLRIELLPDYAADDPDEGTQVQEDGETVGPRTMNMNYARGKQVMPVGRNVYTLEQVKLTNFAPEQPIRLVQFALAVEPRTSK